MIEFCHFPGGLVPLPTPQQATTTYDEPNLKQVCWQLINWPCFPFLCAICGIRGPAAASHERIFRQVTSRLVGTNICQAVDRNPRLPAEAVRWRGPNFVLTKGFSTYELHPALRDSEGEPTAFWEGLRMFAALKGRSAVAKYTATDVGLS